MTEKNETTTKDKEWSDKDQMVYVDGSKRAFACSCGCNVFRQSNKEPTLYKCNACESLWRGE